MYCRLQVDDSYWRTTPEIITSDAWGFFFFFFGYPHRIAEFHRPVGGCSQKQNIEFSVPKRKGFIILDPGM